MKIYKYILLSMPFFASCDTYSYKTPLPEKNQIVANPRVYGDADGPARQSKNPNTNAPDAAEKSALLRAKLYKSMRYDSKIINNKQKVVIDTAKAMAAQQE